MSNKDIFYSKMNALADSINTKASSSGQKNIDTLKDTTDSIIVGGDLNIRIGETTPTDTDKLWINTDLTPEKIKFNESGGLNPTLSYGDSSAVLQTPVINSHGVAVGNKIYYFGGADASYQITKGIFIYDTIADILVELSIETLFNVSNAYYARGKIYLISSGRGVYTFDVNTYEITQVMADGTIPFTYTNYTSCVINDNIYIFGGYVNFVYYSDIYKIDTSNNTIELLQTQLPTALYSNGAAVVGNNAYLFGGYTGSKYTGNPLNVIYKFDASNNSITTLSTVIPTAISGATCIVYGTYIYVCKLVNNSTQFYKFNITTNTIGTVSYTYTGKDNGSGTIAVVCGNKIVLAGGIGFVNTISSLSLNKTLTSDLMILESNSSYSEFELSSLNNISICINPCSVFIGINNIAIPLKMYLYRNNEWECIN